MCFNPHTCCAGLHRDYGVEIFNHLQRTTTFNIVRTMQADHPLAADLEPTWEFVDGVWTRPLLGSESLLDQVHQLCNGHDQLAFGFEITTSVNRGDFEARLTDALIQLRYRSPLVGATIEAGRHHPQLRSWVYRPCKSLEDACLWSIETMHIVTRASPSAFLDELTAKTLQDSQPAQFRLQPFAFYLVLSQDGAPCAVVFHASHALLDGVGALTIFKLFFGWMTTETNNPQSLVWGEEYKNLPRGPVAAAGGARAEWKTLGGNLLKEVGAAFSQPQPPHSLKPTRLEIQDFGKATRAVRIIPSDISAQIIKAAKSQGLSITQVFDAAFALATFKCNPPTPATANDAHVTIYPAIVNGRTSLVPLYPGHDVNTILCVYTSAVPLVVPYSNLSSAREVDTRSQMIAVARSIKDQYAHFLKDPEFVYLVSAEIARAPFHEMPQEANPYWGEITNLGVIEKWLPFRYDESEAVKRVVVIKDILLALRQVNCRPMVHVWSIHGELRLQLQGSDVWEKEQLVAFVDTIIECAKSLIV